MTILARWPSAAFLVLGLAACGGTSEETFAEDLGTTVCRAWDRCFPIDRTGGLPWDTKDECLEEEIDSYETITARAQSRGCRFDEDAAIDCLQRVRAASCDELTSGLDSCATWDCPAD